MRKALSTIVVVSFLYSSAFAGLDIIRSQGITVTGADGINYIGVSGITVTGADGLSSLRSNGITVTGADGITVTGADGTRTVGPNGATYTGPNGITVTGADGITVTGADGITVTGADGITVTGADGKQYTADSILLTRPNGITVTGADGVKMAGSDGVTVTGADGAPVSTPAGITVTGADGITVTGADGISALTPDGITVTGADSVTGFGPNGVLFNQVSPSGITVTGADGITVTGADGITVTGADGILMRGIGDALGGGAAPVMTGLQSVDPELAIALNSATDDSNINAVVIFHNQLTDAELSQLRALGILGGTRFRALPMVYVTATRRQLIAVSRLSSVRSIYGNRTLSFNYDPYYKRTGITRVSTDRDLTQKNGGMPLSGKNVTVAVLDTGINGLHADLIGKLVQNVRLADLQSIPATFTYPIPLEGLPNTDLAAGHGTFVAGVIAGSGISSGGKYGGVAPGARLLGLSTGDVNLVHVLSGLDYLLDKGAAHNVRVVNCSFSANTVYDANDPVNIATKMLTERGVNVVFSAGNGGPGNSSLNPYAMAPWVVSVGATDENGKIAPFSSRGSFGGSGEPTVVAPGVNVVGLRSLVTTTSLGGLLLGADTGRLTVGEVPFYTTASGTSFSAPQVAGAIALMLEADSSLSPAEIKDILARTASPLPKYFAHEVGAGMLNTHAAVLQAAFPARRMGLHRSILGGSGVEFITSTQTTFTHLLAPNVPVSHHIPISANTVQTTFNISWGQSLNDFGLKVYDAGNVLAGESNYLNLPGLTGRRESVTLRNPVPQTFRMQSYNSLAVGTSQNIYGSVESTHVKIGTLRDVGPDEYADVNRSILMNVMPVFGSRFFPYYPISRSEFAATLVRSGFVPQYSGANAAFLDVRDQTTRTAVESAQFSPNGRLFYDASTTGHFFPNESTTRLAAAIALVKAAGLDQAAANTQLSPAITDASSIPLQWRGHVAVALHYGFLSLRGARFDGTRPITRLETAAAFNRLIGN